MFTISNNLHTHNPKIAKKRITYRTANCLQNDFFKKRNEISFKGIQGLFKTSPQLVPQIKILTGISDNFISKITRQISCFSQEWLTKFKQNNYKIILTPSFKKAYAAEGIFDPIVEQAERINPKGTLGVTYSEGYYGKNFFAFCDKPPYSDAFMEGIVNHELSHGVVNIAGLDKNPKVIGIIKKDIELMIKDHKLDKLKPKERELLSRYFFGSRAHLPIDEILADVYAWNKGAGCYGSGVFVGIDNPNLMKNLFPNLSNYLKTI